MLPPAALTAAGSGAAGKTGRILIIRVPKRHMVRDKETGAIIKDMSGDDVTFVIARGGIWRMGQSALCDAHTGRHPVCKSGLPGE
jgi:GTP-binding protein